MPDRAAGFYWVRKTLDAGPARGSPGPWELAEWGRQRGRDGWVAVFWYDEPQGDDIFAEIGPRVESPEAMRAARDELVGKLIDTIEGWDDGHQLRASFANDGDGHMDFMGFRIRPEGRAALAALLNQATAPRETT